MKKRLLLTACLACTSLLAHGSYELIVLDTSTNSSAALAINSYGFSTGYRTIGNKSEPCIWSPAGDCLALPIPANMTMSGAAACLNDNFEIGGTFSNQPFTEGQKGTGIAVVWSFDQDLETFTFRQIGVMGTTVRSINRDGVIGGAKNWYSGMIQNPVTSDSYVMPQPDSLVNAINDSGNGTGIYQESGIYYRCMLLRTNQSGGYDTIAGPAFGFNNTGLAINSSNQIVGKFHEYGPMTSLLIRGFYWDPQTGSNTVFGAQSQCFGINDDATIVGTKNGHAIMWKKAPNGSFTEIDLNDLVHNTNFVMTAAYAINSGDQIVGRGIELSTGVSRAFMLTPAAQAPASLTKINGSSDLKLGWQSAVDHTYRIMYSSDLVTWEAIPGIYWADSTDSWVTLANEGDKAFFKILDLTP